MSISKTILSKTLPTHLTLGSKEHMTELTKIADAYTKARIHLKNGTSGYTRAFYRFFNLLIQLNEVEKNSGITQTNEDNIRDLAITIKEIESFDAVIKALENGEYHKIKATITHY